MFTLLDDVYACKARLEKNGYPFRFSQLLNWRQIECGIVDQFAQVLDIDNVYFAAKHPRITAYWRIFDPKRPRVYSASQITESRKSDEHIAEIEKHRRQLHKCHVLFDPLTLDDRLLINDIPEEVGSTAFQIEQKERWPCDLSDLGDDYMSLVVEDQSLFPLSVEVQEGQALRKPAEKNSRRNTIDVQIRYRDFRYIDQSDVVSAYRPCLNGHESSGVAAEKTYAAFSAERPVVEYSPQADLESFGSKPFSTPLSGPLCQTLDDFYATLTEVANTEASRRFEKNQQRYAKFVAFRDKFALQPAP